MHPATIAWRILLATTVTVVWLQVLVALATYAECKPGEVVVPYLGQGGGGNFCVTGYKYVPEWRREKSK